MKLPIYSVSERKPPLGENVIVWVLDDEGNIDNMRVTQANIAIPDNKEEEELIRPGVSKEIVWSDDGMATEVWLDDVWSFMEVKHGD